LMGDFAQHVVVKLEAIGVPFGCHCGVEAF